MVGVARTVILINAHHNNTAAVSGSTEEVITGEEQTSKNYVAVERLAIPVRERGWGAV